MYRDSAKARVAARDLRRQQVKLFKLGATITLCAFLISQLADMIFLYHTEYSYQHTAEKRVDSYAHPKLYT